MTSPEKSSQCSGYELLSFMLFCVSWFSASFDFPTTFLDFMFPRRNTLSILLLPCFAKQSPQVVLAVLLQQ